MKSIKVKKHYIIVGGDFSAQEPRILTSITNDPTFLEVFRTGKDPYATISSLVFKKSYWECMEHHEDGTPNPDGALLRKKAKTILLGIMYGMGPKLMATNLHIDIDECIEILNEFFNTFPNIKSFTEYNINSAKELGYVEDYMGRRRHLPDAQLDEIKIQANKEIYTDCDLFLDCNTSDCKINIKDNEATNKWSKIYSEKYANKGFKAKTEFKELAKKSDISIRDNGAFISKTMTQCTNARIQGSAATLTKKAMICIDRNEELNKLGFRLLIPVHDELLGECPIENADKVAELLCKTMISAGKPELSVDMSVDAYIVKHWYADEISNTIYNDYHKRIDKGESREDIIEDIYRNHCEFSKNTIISMCDGTFDVLGDV